MIEVDVFWSFAFGASFAACASHNLATSPSKTVNSPFVATLLFLSLLFVPSGTYLLDAFPGWESMFYFTEGRTSISPLLTTTFSFTNTALGVLGFLITASSIRGISEKNLAMNPSYHKYWVHSYSCFTAILGMGYYRFTYAGNYKDWRDDVTFPMTDFIGSPVFNTLLVMGVVFVPAIYYIMASYASDTFTRAAAAAAIPISPSQVKSAVLKYIIKIAVVDYLLISAGWLGAMATYYKNDWAYFEHGWAGMYAPLVGFAVGHTVVFALVLVPLFMSWKGEGSMMAEVLGLGAADGWVGEGRGKKMSSLMMTPAVSRFPLTIVDKNNPI
ncbi:hypothetical protein HK104_002885 [Borealophlyctis nickersoniae]|nr:hypothetical protein HK104_002885 [Borealophlyctis nickersoniae]